MISPKKELLINITWNILPFLVLLIFLLPFHQNIYSFDADDSYFVNAQEKYSFPEFLTGRYNNWSGRLSIEATMYFVLGHNIKLWRLINPLVLTGLCINLAILLFGIKFWSQTYQITAKTIWFICFGIGLINMQVLGSSSFWITGSFNYLWPIVAGSFALIPFRQRLFSNPIRLSTKSTIFYVFALLAALYASLGNEQVAIVLIGLMLIVNIVLFISTKNVEPVLLLITLVTLIGFIINCTAPGNQNRFEQSIILYFPNYRDLTIGQHLFVGIRWLLDKTVNINRIMLIILFAFLAMSLRQNASSKANKILSSFATFFAAFLIVSSLHLDSLHPKLQEWVQQLLFSFKDTGEFVHAYAKLGRNYNFILFFIPYLIWIPVLLSVPFMLSRIERNEVDHGLILAILFCLAIASLVPIFFSPTIYESGNRTIAIYSVILLFILSSLFFRLQDRIPMTVILSIFLLATFNLIFQYVEWSHKYFIHW